MDYEETWVERVPRLFSEYKFHLLAGLGGLVLFTLIAWGLYTVYQNTPAPITSGVVVEREFTPAHWEDYQRPVTRTRPATRTVCSTTNGNQSCRTETYIETYTDYVWDTRWVNDDWDLTVHGCSLDRQGDEHCRNTDIDVNEDTYDLCAVGRTWRRETECLPQ